VAYRTPESALRSFGALIARKRLAAGMSAQELADKVGVSPTLISKIENGQREPRLEIIKMLEKELDIACEVFSYIRTGRF